jgi:ABC-type Fe3+ transport system substrate-binding protein
MMAKYLAVFAALAVTLVAPWLLRPKVARITSAEPRDTLVIISPHVENIRAEFTRGFQAYMNDKYGRGVAIEWLTPGGTSEIDRYLDTEFRAAFEAHWKATQSEPWRREFAGAVGTAKLAADAPAGLKSARDYFLNSNLGVKIDVFFGGGTYDFDNAKRKGYLVATDPSGKHGLAALKQSHPDWFADSVIPQTFAGSNFYDPDLCWSGNCLGAFGICYNKDVLERLNIYDPPKQWEDLADPKYFGYVAIADPSKSASAAAAFEMILQQQIQNALARAKALAAKPASPEVSVPTVEEAVAEGWIRGMQLIQKIGANARYFTDSAPKPPLDVSKGEAAAGMCIDFYGRTFVERLQRPDGTCRFGYVTPEGGSALNADPIAMFRGAPNPELATHFMEFVLSPEGQRLWGHRTATPGGPQRVALRRLPIRKDYYVQTELGFAADPDALPYEKTTFVYQPKHTAPAFRALRMVIRAMCMDTHDELKEAWTALQQAKFPPKATAHFSDVRLVSYDKVMSGLTEIFNGRDKIKQARALRDLVASFRNQYQSAAELARRRE